MLKIVNITSYVFIFNKVIKKAKEINANNETLPKK